MKYVSYKHYGLICKIWIIRFKDKKLQHSREYTSTNLIAVGVYLRMSEPEYVLTIKSINPAKYDYLRSAMLRMELMY